MALASFQAGKVGESAMKTTLFVVAVLFLLCSISALGQAVGSVSSEVIVQPLPEHPQHADIHPMAVEHPLVGAGYGTYTSEHGERPLWEFGMVKQEPSLGDVARAYRKEKTTAKKAEVTLEKQGS